MSHGFNLYVRALFQTGIRDHQCGCKGFRRSVTPLLQDVRNTGFLFDTEFLVRAVNRYTVREVPVRWREKGQEINTVSAAVSMFAGLLRLRARLL
jgi:hypothetical protein